MLFVDPPKALEFTGSSSGRVEGGDDRLVGLGLM